jgi:hypothetical protein
VEARASVRAPFAFTSWTSLDRDAWIGGDPNPCAQIRRDGHFPRDFVVKPTWHDT